MGYEMKRFERAFAQWVVTHRLLIIVLTLILVPLAMTGMQHFRFSNSYRIFFSADNPQLLAFDKLENTYTKNDNVLFLLTPKDGNVFTRRTLEAVVRLSSKQMAWQIPYSIRVDSITNFQYTEARGDELIVRDLVRKPGTLTPAQLKRIREIALNEPLLVRRLVSPSGHVTAVNVTIQLPGKNIATETPQVVAYARKLAAQMRKEFPDIEVRLAGMIMMNNAFSEAAKNDMRSLVPISFAVMLIFLALMIRGVTGTLATLLVIAFSIIIALGLGMYFGFPFSPPLSSAPTIILTVAIANSVHIVVTFLQVLRTGADKQDAMAESLRINLQPVFLTSITTALGFLSMLFSEVPPFRHLGIIVSIGVLASFVLAVTFLPALVTLLPVRSRLPELGHDHLMQKIGDFVVRQRRKLIWGMGTLAVVLISFIPRNELNDVFVHYFDKKIEFRRDVDYAAANLNGGYLIDYSLESGKPGGLNEPAVLRDIERFANWYRKQPEVQHVNVITDIIKRLNKNMHGDDPRWYRLPDRRNLTAQYLLLYEMSLPYGLDLNNQIDVDKSATRMTVTTRILSSNEIIALERRAAAWLKDNAPNLKQAVGTGATVMFAHIGKRNIISMLRGTTVALIFISLILVLAFRSLKIGLVSMVPNLIPAAMGFGLWGLLVGEVGLALSVVSGMTLGIVVDDTVHFLSKYLRARREQGLVPAEAVRYAFTTVGRALAITSIVLVAGFLILALSSFKLNSGMGILTAIVITFALLADFFLLPPLLMKLEGDKK